MTTLSDSLEKKYYNRFINKEVEILVENVKDGESIGHTSNYLEVRIPEVLTVGKIYRRTL